MSVPFTYLLRVRYGECDPQNVVFNGRYVDYADVAMTEFMRALIGDYSNLLEAGLDMQVVNLNVSWQGPARADEVIAASVEVTRIGRSSITMMISMSHHGSGKAIADVEVVYVMVSAGKYTKVDVPQALREKLMAGAPGVVMNHAGV